MATRPGRGPTAPDGQDSEGAQDTGGSDRTRTLETTAAGTCSVMVTLTTGTSLNESFKGKAFQVETLITIE